MTRYQPRIPTASALEVCQVYDQIPERLWDKYYGGETIIKEFNFNSLKRIIKTAFHLEYGIR